MPTLSVGRTNAARSASTLACRVPTPGNARRRQEFRCGTLKRAPRSGITLVEMLVVVTLISLMVGISFPAITSGIDSLRLNAATNSIVGFFNTGLNRAERRQQVVEITILKVQNTLSMRSTDPGFTLKLDLPDGISINRILPDLPPNPDGTRNFMLYPGGTVPHFGVALVNRRNVERIVSVDPMTGVPQVERPQP